jgi:lipid II:glycine glycyltransferase (peptidoglycan interpeptide bridge formation enzyme)
MDLSSYRLEKAELNEEWDTFVDEAEQGTVFSQRPFIEALDRPVALWRCLKKNEPKAVIALTLSENGRQAIHSGLLVYNGILFARPDVNQSPAQIASEEFRITSFIINELSEMYEQVAFATHPTFRDMRPFTWFNYGEKGPHFDLSLRYTTVLDLAGELPSPLDDSAVYHRLNKSRRQEIRYARKENIKTVETDDIDQFTQLYELTFERQSLEVPAGELKSITASLENLASQGKLKLFASSTEGGAVGSMAAFALDRKRAYFAFGANHPDARDSYTGTMVLWHAFDRLKSSGVSEIDLEGVNSPTRGYFKMSFGGKLLPYYIVSLPAA